MLAQRPALDESTFAALARLFRAAKSLAVQRAVATLLVRADYRGGDSPEHARLLREHRRVSPEGRDVIDVLIKRLAAT